MFSETGQEDIDNIYAKLQPKDRPTAKRRILQAMELGWDRIHLAEYGQEKEKYVLSDLQGTNPKGEIESLPL